MSSSIRGADKHDAVQTLGRFAGGDAFEGDNEPRLMRGGRRHHERSALGEECFARGQSFEAITPQVDETWPLQPVSLDDPPDFERGTLVGHG